MSYLEPCELDDPSSLLQLGLTGDTMSQRMPSGRDEQLSASSTNNELESALRNTGTVLDAVGTSQASPEIMKSPGIHDSAWLGVEADERLVAQGTDVSGLNLVSVRKIPPSEACNACRKLL